MTHTPCECCKNSVGGVDCRLNVEEECVQFHSKESEYVNLHPHCLHMWRNQSGNMKKPPVEG